MSQTTVSIRMDNELKNNFDHICTELGMSMSTAVTMLAKKMTREQRLPFELSVDPFYSEQNMARLRIGLTAPGADSPPRIHRASDDSQARTPAATHHHTEKPSAK